MAIRKLRFNGDEVLRKRAKEITVFDDKLKELAQDMIETMHKENGVGLAGQQIGLLKRIFVVDLYDGNEPFAVINPVIVKEKGEQVPDEGCLSVPNQFAKIKRPKEVVLEYQDLEGNHKKMKAKDLLAEVFCHETDHLNGILYIDKIIPGTEEYAAGFEKPDNTK